MATLILTVRNLGETSTWEEDYPLPPSSHQKWADNLIKHFNLTLRSGEKLRELVSIRIVDEDPAKHTWGKTSLTTQTFRGDMFDAYKCSNCGITGKRYGLEPGIVYDPPFQAKIYRHCGKAKQQLEKLRKRRAAKGL